jgi:osmotically-inducible protein OsmY
MEPTTHRSNVELQSDVTDALERSDDVNSEHLGVSAHEGVVTLAGSVDDRREQAAAYTAAREVPGVTDVTDETALRRKEAEEGLNDGG